MNIPHQSAIIHVGWFDPKTGRGGELLTRESWEAETFALIKRALGFEVDVVSEGAQ